MASTNGATPRPPRNGDIAADDGRRDSLLRRSWYAMSDLLSPFSPSALSSLPKQISRHPRYTRADHIPDTGADNEGQQPLARDYHSINLPPNVRVPKKIATPIKVEGKVWFANERTWVSYMNTSVLVGSLALALFNASKDDIARNFAYIYAFISVGTLVYGYAIYQHRITMIRRRDPGSFDQVLGPVLISICLFVAVFANFIIRLRELRRQNIPIPGSSFFAL